MQDPTPVPYAPAHAEMQDLTPVPRILVVQTRRLGDVLMLTPLLRALAHHDPAARVDVLVEPGTAAALAGNPHVAALVEATPRRLAVAARLRRARYDIVIDAMGKTTSALLALASGAATRVGSDGARLPWCYTHRVPPAAEGSYAALEKLRLLQPLGVETTDCTLELPGGREAGLKADTWWLTLGLGDGPAPIAFAPVSRRVEKQWPAERFAWMADQLAERTGRALLLLHGPGESAQVTAVLARAARRAALIVPREVLPFEALPAALARCAAYAGNDNGIRHVAVGLGLPTLAIFGRPSPSNWTPPGDARHLTVGGRRDIGTIGIGEVAPALDAFGRLL